MNSVREHWELVGFQCPETSSNGEEKNFSVWKNRF